VVSLVNGIVFLSHFGEERAQSGWGCGRVTELLAEVGYNLTHLWYLWWQGCGTLAWSRRRSKLPPILGAIPPWKHLRYSTLIDSIVRE